jgi:hypothetical protein
MEKAFFHRNTDTKFDQNPLSKEDHEKFMRFWVKKMRCVDPGESVI